MADAKTASVSDAMNQKPHDDVPSAPAAPAGPAGGQGMNQGVQVLSYLIAGIATYGFLGWLADHFLGTSFWLPVGIVLGAALSIYVVIRRFTTEATGGSAEALHPTTTRGRV